MDKKKAIKLAFNKTAIMANPETGSINSFNRLMRLDINKESPNALMFMADITNSPKSTASAIKYG
jgi:hypothetical protein